MEHDTDCIRLEVLHRYHDDNFPEVGHTEVVCTRRLMIFPNTSYVE